MERMFGYEKKQVFRFAYLFAVVAGIYLAFRYLLPLIWPFVFAYLAAGLLRPVAEFLTRRTRMKVGIGSILVSLSFFAILGTGLFFLCRLGILQLVQLLSNLGDYRGMADEKLCAWCTRAERFLALEEGTLLREVEDGIDRVLYSAKSGIFEEISGHGTQFLKMAGKTLTFLLVFFIGTVLILRDMLCAGCNDKVDCSVCGPESEKTGKSRKEACGNCRDRAICSKRLLRQMHAIKDSLASVGLAYLKTQGILFLVIGGICSLGFTLMKNRYALVAGFGIGLLDAFPVLGSGMILVPWAVVKFLFGHYAYGIALLIIYLVCQITRELLEPRLLGNQIGIRPIYTLISMYVGLKLFGVVGFLLGPLGLVTAMALWEHCPGIERQHGEKDG